MRREERNGRYEAAVFPSFECFAALPSPPTTSAVLGDGGLGPRSSALGTAVTPPCGHRSRARVRGTDRSLCSRTQPGPRVAGDVTGRSRRHRWSRGPRRRVREVLKELPQRNSLAAVAWAVSRGRGGSSAAFSGTGETGTPSQRLVMWPFHESVLPPLGLPHVCCPSRFCVPLGVRRRLSL